MDQLNPHNKEHHEGTEVVKKQKQEYKFLGSSKRKPGQNLYALDKDTKEVYEVILKTRVATTLDGKNIGTHKAYVKEDDPRLWAINRKNAIRKFKKAVHEKFRELVH